MSNNLVAYSRAGDVFHYRWAARRCLQLIYPNSPVQSIVIEGSKERKKVGEYVIDVSEYAMVSSNRSIRYCQLKHTTVRKNTPFNGSDLSKTLAGFAKRFRQHAKAIRAREVTVIFAIITNRKISDRFKAAVRAIGAGQPADARIRRSIEKMTSLGPRQLPAFCQLLQLEDGEGDFQVQRHELRAELAHLAAGAVDNAEVNNLVALVEEKVLPLSNHIICREDVLRIFGMSSESELYPAPAVLDELPNVVVRQQHKILSKEIVAATRPVLIHAAGGVGKSVFCRQVVRSLPPGSIAIVFDCFGGGKYRNRSETRHRHKTALVQIVNELASRGLCEPLFNNAAAQEEDLMRKFLFRLETTIRALRKTRRSAKLIILVDAADNAEMAAKEFGEKCFAHELIRESLPDGCKLAVLCRTERIPLLHPQESTPQFELTPFSPKETTAYLRRIFPRASIQEALEFHRLTAGNPRVQANALDTLPASVDDLLRSLGPSPVTVEEQIQARLQRSIQQLRDLFPEENRAEINSICLGLALLPPLIPIDILARASGMSTDHIRSFVADMGRPLWVSDKSVQFRDEPTETWFRKQFLARKEDYKRYVDLLEPLGTQSPYVANVLPQLYLGAEEYDRLVQIALSDEFLPDTNPIDTRNARIYRLQFSFKAALRLNRFDDAIKLAMRAGEEMAGNNRQLTLFINNVDLLTSLQDSEMVKEIAFKRLLGGHWMGSDNLYSASLLSGISEYRGEAGGYLRAGLNWLNIYFEDRRRRPREDHEPRLQSEDLLECAYAKLNLHGIKASLDFLRRLEPKEAIFPVIKGFAKRLIDLGRTSEISQLVAQVASEPYYISAATDELLKVGTCPGATDLNKGLNRLCAVKSRIKKPEDRFDDPIVPAILSFAEACVHRELSPRKILCVLDYYVPVESRFVYNNHNPYDRTRYLRAAAMRAVLARKTTLDTQPLIASTFSGEKKTYQLDQEIKELREVAEGLFPWFLLRAQLLANMGLDIADAMAEAAKASAAATASRYRSGDNLPAEIADLCLSILIFYPAATSAELLTLYESYLEKEISFRTDLQLRLLRAAYRLTHLAPIRSRLEQSTYQAVRARADDYTDEIADRYVSLSRAVLISSVDDAASYFEKAISITSKFGDELVQRWESVVGLAKKASEKGNVSDELAYRFLRCAELVGENVSREKHWSRYQAVSVAAQLSPGIAVSGVSRWRDREVGRPDIELESLLIQLVRSGRLPGEAGWAMTWLFSDRSCYSLLEACLAQTPDQGKKVAIATAAIRSERLAGAPKECWKKLAVLFKKHRIQDAELTEVLDFYSIALEGSESDENESRDRFLAMNADHASLRELIVGLNVSIPTGFAASLARFDGMSVDGQSAFGLRDLLATALHSVKWEDFPSFVDVVLASDRFNHYDVRTLLRHFPSEWKQKVSYQKRWEKTIQQFGKRFADEMCNHYVFQSFVEEFDLTDAMSCLLRDSIIGGLAEGLEFTSASLFFEFVRMAATKITPVQAAEALSFALSRFEMHMAEEFADGPWNDWLKVSSDTIYNIAGYLWSVLGSPHSAVRWRAAHVVRQMAAYHCSEMLNRLVDCVNESTVGAFGSNQYPFYALHARQYLLIALARVAIDHPNQLVPYRDTFAKLALSEPHALIQRFAAEAAETIEKACPGSFSQSTMEAIRLVSISPFPIEEKDSRYQTDSYWHQTAIVRPDHSTHFAYDFDNYWFEPLGRVFGVPGRQIEELAASVQITDWGMPADSDKRGDPRTPLWNRSSRERGTWHDHGTYPKVDDLNFYYSYHAMMVVAAKLLHKMAIIKQNEWEDNEWEDWIARHRLSRNDGKWLADCRDPLPLKRPNWISTEQRNEWRNPITCSDFMSGLVTDVDAECWMNVKGGWSEREGHLEEGCTISSALVSKTTAHALLRALSSCANPHDYRLPYYDEADMEINCRGFFLKGWIAERDRSRGLDDLDPESNRLDYPPFAVGEHIADRLGLTVHNDGKCWRESGTTTDVLICETWSSAIREMEEEPGQSGMRLRASLPFLKRICSALDCYLIFDIGIGRSTKDKYQTGTREYVPPTHKIYILSEDGTLRTTDANYELG